MSSDREALEEKQKVRYKILKTIYDETENHEGSKNQMFSVQSVAKSLEPDERKVSRAMEYLEQEFLLRRVGYDPREGEIYTITHNGIVEIEHSIQHPDQGTNHFLLSVIQHFNGPVGSVQMGSNATANVDLLTNDDDG